MAHLDPSKWKVHDDAFHHIVGERPLLECLLTVQEYPFAHEAGVFLPLMNELWITSNQFFDSRGNRKVQITKLVLDQDGGIAIREEVECKEIHMGNGGTNDKDNHILFCAQGSMTTPSGLFRMSPVAPYKTEPVLTAFYGRPFNSVNDVVVSSDGCYWFTDPSYGFKQGYRPTPVLPSQIYRFDPRTSSIRAVADGIKHPNGLCLSPDERVMYVTDTDFVHGDGSIDPSRASTIYAYDVTMHYGQPFLSNKRLFAFVDVGVPDGIKCDIDGNVYSGCGDGVNVWSPGGLLLGRILVEGGAANLCFGRGGNLFILNEHHLWRAKLNSVVMGAILKV
ncbi:hypothetical protein ANO14919_018350 [Xylariales sp. No.14919]|nr:hypothetical protein ANO14919_018350 [Xylariales sp. No.14919]